MTPLKPVPALIRTLAALALLSVDAASADDQVKSVVYEVEAGGHDRRDTPLMVKLPEGWQNETGFALEDLDSHAFVPVQVAAYHVNGFFGVSWVARGTIPAGTARRYRLSTDSRNAASPPPGGGVHALHDGKPIRNDGGAEDARPSTMTLKVGDRPVLTYQAAEAMPPAGIDPLYRRSGFIHPLQTPSGAAVTDDFPPDHPHQHGVFFAWVNTTFEGRRVDFWNQKDQTGRVAQDNSRDAYGTDVDDGPVFGKLIASLLHEDLTAPPDVQVKVLGVPLVGKVAKRVMREVWQVVVYDTPGAFVVDFQSAQHVDHHPLTVNTYHYGGFGLRGNRQWFDPAATGETPPEPSRSGRSDFLTSEGKRRGDGNHTRPRWVDLSGAVDGKFCGVTVLDHPGNFRFPQPVRLHPNKPYFCFAPMVLGDFPIVVGKPYVSRYRLVVHDGPPDPALIERLWNDYADPPRVRIVAGGG